MFTELTKWDDRPDHLRVMAYGWCSAIRKEFPGPVDGKELLLLSLEISFRGLDFRYRRIEVRPIHMKLHQHMAHIVFNSEDGGGDR